MDLLTGNAYAADTAGTGWFIGFSDWTRLPGSDLLHIPRDQALHGLCVKWFDHGGGQSGGHSSSDLKPISDGRTVSVLVTPGSHFTIEFSLDPSFPASASRTVHLQNPGDYAAWGAGLHHRWHCAQRATIMTIRWRAAAPESFGKTRPSPP
jgi:hypothetical protein